MIKEIRNFVFDFLRVRIFGGNNNFCCLFTTFFKNFINSLIE